MPPRPAQAEYPAHIDRHGIEVLPDKPGVYFFRDRRGAPIYIGKSVNIRARVLAHLRAPQEAAMLRQARSVDFERTAGEIGALLRESKLIKQLQPAYNVLLREAGEIFSIGLAADDSRPQIVDSADPEFAADALYGMFASRSTAQAGLQALVRQHGLCPAILGLETAVRGRACFARQIGRCRGACIGAEPLLAHQARLRHALEQLHAAVWPYAGPIGIIEQCDDLRQMHVIDRWSYLDTLQGRRTRFRRPARPAIDIDVYKILARPLAQGALTIIQLAQRAA